MQANQTQLIKLGDGKKGIEQNTVNLDTISPEIIDSKSVDLVSIKSDDFEKKDDDEISFVDESRLQEWNFIEFKKQVGGTLSAIVLLLCCGLISAWSISDLMKDIQHNEAQWVDIDYSFELFENDEDEFLSSRHVVMAMVVLSFNFGIIIGAIFGAFLTPLLPNRVTYVMELFFYIHLFRFTVIDCVFILNICRL